MRFPNRFKHVSEMTSYPRENNKNKTIRDEIIRMGLVKIRKKYLKD